MNDRKLIELIEHHRVIYDKSCKDFKNIKKKNTIWEDIGRQLNTSAEIVQRRWKVLRDRYTKERRDQIYLPSGADGDSGTSGWEYYDSLCFLEPYVRSRRTSTNIIVGRDVRDEVICDREESCIEHTSSSCSPLLPKSEVTSDIIMVEKSTSATLPPSTSSPIVITVEQSPSVTLPSAQSLTPLGTTFGKSSSAILPPSTPSLTPIITSVGESPATPSQGYKRRQRESQAVDDTISSIATYFKNKTVADSDMAFGNSIGLQLKGLPKYKKNIAKIKIMEILAELDSE